MEVDPTRSIFKEDSTQAKWMSRSPLIGGALLLGTAVVAGIAIAGRRDSAQLILFTLAACWAIGPPLWFLTEYHWVYRIRPGDNSWELFKHGQQLAIAVWASVAATLYALGSSDLAKPREVQYQCSVEPAKDDVPDTQVPQSVFFKCRPQTVG